MSPLFDELYASGGRPSIPSEHQLQSSLLVASCTVRSEGQFWKQRRYSLRFKWSLDLNVENEPFHPTTFAKNRGRLLEADVARGLVKEIVREARRRRLLSPITSPSTARCWRPGPCTRATVRATRVRLAAAGATNPVTKMVSAAARRTSRPPSPKLGSTAKDPRRRQGFAISAICGLRTVTAWSLSLS